jgi:hypothetical protein
LQPVKIRGTPAISLASYRKQFRIDVSRMAETVDDKNGELRRIELENDLLRPGQIGQLLGFANARDESANLYRQICLTRLGERDLTYNDYWDSLEEYEAYMKFWSDRGDQWLVKKYEEMREGVTWLVGRRDMLSQLAAEWRLLFRVDSNGDMGLNMMDGDPLYIFVREESVAKRDFADLAGEVTQG